MAFSILDDVTRSLEGAQQTNVQNAQDELSQSDIARAGAAVAGGAAAAAQAGQAAAGATPQSPYSIKVNPNSPGLFYVMKDGKQVESVSLAGLTKRMQEWAQSGLVSADQANAMLKDAGFDAEVGSDGKLTVKSYPTSQGQRAAGPANRPTNNPAPAPSGSGGSAGGGASFGSGGGGPSGGSIGGGGGMPALPGVQTGGTTTGNGGITLGGGAGGEAAAVDLNRALGLDFGGSQPGVVGGANYRSDRYGRPGSVLSGLDAKSSANDVLLNVVRAQEANRDAALGIFGGEADRYDANSLRQGIEGRSAELLANPFSLDDATIARIQAKQGEQIGQGAQRQSQLSAARAASSGITRSGMQQADQDRIGINADRQLGDTQRALLVEQATRRPQELQSATASASDVLNQQQSARERMAAGAAGVLAGTDYSADFALAGQLAGSPVKNGDRVAMGPRQGPIAGIAYAGDPNLNPFR